MVSMQMEQPAKKDLLDTMVEKYLIYKASPDISEKTMRHYENLLLRFCDFWVYIYRRESLSGAASEIQHEHLKEFIVSLRAEGCTPPTTNNYTSILKDFFGYLKREGVVDKDPSADLKFLYYSMAEKARIRRSKVFYTDEEIQRTLDYLRSHSSRMKIRDTALIALQLATSIRISEACSLNVSHFAQMKEGHFECVCKGGVKRNVQIARFAIPLIESYLMTRMPCSDDEPLFVTRDGNRLNRNAAWKALARAQRVLGLRTGTHSYRRTAISNVAKNVNVVVAMRVAGHSSVAVTNEYLLVDEAEEQSAINNTTYSGFFGK